MLWRKSMKFLKNIFGSKQNKKSKFKSNTLAEANGSPDLRLATAKEKESDVPVLKKEEVKKTPKKATSATASGTKNTADKVKKVEIEEVKSSEIVPTKATKTANDQSASEQKKATTDKKSVTQKKYNEGKVEVKKAPKKSETEVKAATTTVEKKTTTKSEDAKNTPKKDVKSAKETAEKVVENTEATVVSKSAKTGKFEIKKSKDGRFVFNLYASNSVIVATSQVYSSSASALNGIKSVIANAESAPIEDQTLKKFTPVPYPKWEIYLDKGEEYRFRLCASNGSCVCHSQGYTSKANCKNGIESIIKTAKDAEIIKAYLDKNDK